MKNWHIIACLLCSALIIGTGCSGDDSQESNNNSADVELNDVDQTDAGQGDSGQTDSGQDADGDRDTDEGCVEDCDESSVTITSAGKEFPFTQAAYGLTSPEHADSGKWELYIELWEDGFEGCPVENSPSPSRAILVNGLSLDDAGDLIIGAKLSLVLLDYYGKVFEEDRDKPVIRPTSVSATGESWEFCTECLTGGGGADEKNGELVVKLEAEFEKGSLRGEFKAQHCDSMDLL